jgi:hypothetical protein
VENAAVNNITMMLYSDAAGGTGAIDPTCSAGAGSTLLHANVKVNTAIVLSPVTSIPAHEIGHEQGIGHIASDSAVIRYDTGRLSEPQAQDVELQYLLYPETESQIDTPITHNRRLMMHTRYIAAIIVSLLILVACGRPDVSTGASLLTPMPASISAQLVPTGAALSSSGSTQAEAPQVEQLVQAEKDSTPTK